MPKQNQMTYRNSYTNYNPTTEAKTAAKDYYRKQPKAAKRAVKKRKKTVFVMSGQAKNLGFSIYFMILLAFLLLLGVVIAGANVTLQRNYNTQLANQLRHIEIQNNQLRNQINQARNLEDIEYIARTRLGMSEPSAHQVQAVTLIPAVYVEAVFTDYLDYNYDNTSSISDFFRSIINFFTER